MSTPQSPPKIIFILDFDGTITYKDTISALFSSAVNFQQSQGKGDEAGRSLEYILSEYSKDLTAFGTKRRQKIGEEGVFKSLGDVVKYQRGLRDVEMRSFERVSREGIFSGIGSERFVELGRRAVQDEKDGVVIRSGFEEFIKKLETINGTWGIVSVNFSESWIRGILRTYGRNVKIYTNQPGENGCLRGPHSSDGKQAELLVSSEGKLIAMKGMLSELGRDENTKVLYIGDSSTDIECLLEEVGIIMVDENGNSKLKGVLDGVGGDPEYDFSGEIIAIREHDTSAGKAIYFAQDFRDLIASPLFN